MPSESPFDKLGRAISVTVQRRHPLFQGTWENAFTVAHAAVGEWRAWRALCDANGITDPLTLAEPDITGLVTLTSVDGLIDFTFDLGTTVLCIGGNLPGDNAEVIVTDTVAGEFDLQLRRVGEANLGPAVHLREVDWYDASGAAQPFRVALSTADLVHWVELEFTTDAWLVLWLARELRLTFDRQLTRVEVAVPAPELGT